MLKPTTKTHMKIQDSLKIIGERDNASVTLNENGTIYVGAMTLTRQEAADYPFLLDQAIKRTLALPVSGRPE